MQTFATVLGCLVCASQGSRVRESKRAADVGSPEIRRAALKPFDVARSSFSLTELESLHPQPVGSFNMLRKFTLFLMAYPALGNAFHSKPRSSDAGIALSKALPLRGGEKMGASAAVMSAAVDEPCNGSSCADPTQFAPTKDGAPTKDECKALLDLVRTASYDELIERGWQPLTSGFAHHVWSTNVRGWEVVIKRYTDLAFLRCDADTIGCLDVYSGDHGIGPRVLYSSSEGLVMEKLEGRTLEEIDMHSDNFDLLDETASAVARLHALPTPAAMDGPPMLWRTVDVMLAVAARRPELWPKDMPSIEAVSKEVNEVKAALKEREFGIVLSHGDLKPSNVIRHTNGHVRIIDHELSGPNYRGFDLMKLFRTGQKSSDVSMKHFLKAYTKILDSSRTEDDVANIMEEAKTFLPLTWLEASAFFLALAQFKPEDASKWNDLAVDRWKKFEETKHMLQPSKQI